jgi:hypothetical protein
MEKELRTKSGREVTIPLHLTRHVVICMCTPCTMEHAATHHLSVSQCTIAHDVHTQIHVLS